MLKPFFQGKLDTFCAIYAVLNALRLTHGIQTLKARDILNETLLSLAGKPGALRAVLEQDTDYMQLVDDMIQARRQRYPLLVEKPFAEGEVVSPDALWEACREWLAPGVLSRIYLNFSDPWPKAGYAKRRLTHRRFLELYRSLLRAGGEVWLKTDNEGLFDFSLEEFSAVGLTILYVSRDFHAAPESADNIMTEYERNFSSQGKPIFCARVRF